MLTKSEEIQSLKLDKISKTLLLLKIKFTLQELKVNDSNNDQTIKFKTEHITELMRLIEIETEKY